MIILFNGPPNSGKDACAEFVKNKFPDFEHLSFKDKLIDDTCFYYGVDRDWFMDQYDNRELKETPYAELGGLSKRQALIHVSEDIMKPTHGKSYFGDAVAAGMTAEGYYVFSDCGFVEELEPLIRTGHSIVVVQIVREGCDFSNDSRRYLPVPEMFDSYGTKIECDMEYHPDPDNILDADNVVGFVLYNTGTLQDMFARVTHIVEEEIELDAHYAAISQ